MQEVVGGTRAPAGGNQLKDTGTRFMKYQKVVALWRHS